MADYWQGYFGSADGAVATRRTLGNQNASIMDDVMDVMFAEFPEDGGIRVFENYADPVKDDCIVLEQTNDRTVLDHELTITVRFTALANTTREARRIIDRALTAIDESSFCNVADRYSFRTYYGEDSGVEGKEMASRDAEIR